jgi:hypothetical protein
MASLNADYSIEQGSTFVLEFQIFDEELQPVNLLASTSDISGTTYSLDSYRMRMKIRRTKYRDSLMFFCGTTQNYVVQPTDENVEFTQDGFYFLGGTAGIVRVVISSNSTGTMKACNYFYDIEMVKSITGGSVVSKLMSGKIDFDAETTT